MVSLSPSLLSLSSHFRSLPVAVPTPPPRGKTAARSYHFRSEVRRKRQKHSFIAKNTWPFATLFVDHSWCKLNQDQCIGKLKLISGLGKHGEQVECGPFSHLLGISTVFLQALRCHGVAVKFLGSPCDKMSKKKSQIKYTFVDEVVLALQFRIEFLKT